MRSLDLLKASLLIASISGLVFDRSLLTFIIFICAIILNLKNKIKFRFLLVGSFIYGLLFLFSNQQLLNQMPENNSVQELRLIVYPDEISIDGDNLKLVGTIDKKKAIAYVKIENKEIKALLEKNLTTLEFLIKGKVDKFDLPTNQFQFNQREYNFRNGICIKIDKATIVEIDSNPQLNMVQKIVGYIRTTRVKLIAFFNTLPKNLSEYSQALIVGFVPQDFYQENNGLVDLGLIHLFTISGFHVSYLIKMIFNSFRKLLSAKIINYLTTFVLLVFFILSGNNQVLLRAILAGEIVLLANIFHKSVDNYFVWAVSLLVGLIFTPQILLTVGGQLSYLLTFSMLWIGNLNAIKANSLLSLVTVPIIIGMRFSWHLLSLPINFMVIPFFGTVILPVVLIGILFNWAPAIVNICDQIIYLFNLIINKIANLPGQLIFGEINSYLILPIVVTMMIIFISKNRLKKLSTIFLLTVLLFQYGSNHYFTKGELTIFDIGQGDSILIRQPNNKNVTLIDTGGQLDFNNSGWRKRKNESNKGNTIIVNYLHAKGVSKIDQLVLTHQDQDHIGYAGQILDSIKVDQLIIPDGMQNTDVFKQKLLPHLKNTIVLPVTSDTESDLPFSILYPFDEGQAENEDSIAIATKIGNLNFFSAGDLDQDGEKRIIDRYPNLKFEIVKLGHHGSKTSSNYQSLKQFDIKYAIVSAGRDNRYGHPHKETLETLKQLKTVNFNTQTNGMIKFEFDNSQIFNITTVFNDYSNENQFKTITR